MKNKAAGLKGLHGSYGVISADEDQLLNFLRKLAQAAVTGNKRTPTTVEAPPSSLDKGRGK